MKTSRAYLVACLSVFAILFNGTASASLGKANERTPPPRELAREKSRFDANALRPRVVAARAVTMTEATSQAIGGSFGTVDVDSLGIDRAAVTPTSSEGSAAGTCRYVEYVHSRGIWPYGRSHHAGTYWCYVYNSHITYRRTNTWGRTDPVCANTNNANWRMSGGAGYRWVKVHSEAWFSCSTPWWFPLNDSLWMQIAYNVFGNSAVEGSNT